MFQVLVVSTYSLMVLLVMFRMMNKKMKISIQQIQPLS